MTEEIYEDILVEIYLKLMKDFHPESQRFCKSQAHKYKEKRTFDTSKTETKKKGQLLSKEKQQVAKLFHRNYRRPKRME